MDQGTLLLRTLEQDTYKTSFWRGSHGSGVIRTLEQDTYKAAFRSGAQIVGVIRTLEQDTYKAAFRSGAQIVGVIRDLEQNPYKASFWSSSHSAALFREIYTSKSYAAQTYYYIKRAKDSSQGGVVYGYWTTMDPNSEPPFPGGPWVYPTILSKNSVG